MGTLMQVLKNGVDKLKQNLKTNLMNRKPMHLQTLSRGLKMFELQYSDAEPRQMRSSNLNTSNSFLLVLVSKSRYGRNLGRQLLQSLKTITMSETFEASEAVLYAS
jgi:hypothetical protein